MRFKGRIRFDDVTGADLDCFVEVDETHVHFVSGEESLGSWCLADVVANRVVANVFEIDLDGEVVTFLADDQVNFAYGAVQSMAEGWARFHALNLLRRKSAIAAARRANEPSRLDEARHAFATAREELEVSGLHTGSAPDEAAAGEDVIEPVSTSEPVGASSAETTEGPVPEGGGFWDRVKRATGPAGEDIADADPVEPSVAPVSELEPVVEPEAMPEPEPEAGAMPELEPEPEVEATPEADRDGDALPTAARLPRLDALPRKRMSLRPSEDADEHQGPVVQPGQIQSPVIPAAARDTEDAEEPEVVETPVVGEQVADEDGMETEEPAASPSIESGEEAGALDPVDEAPMADEPEAPPETDVEVDARSAPEDSEAPAAKKPSSNGHGAHRREPAVIGAYGDGHHPAETSGLRASMKSLFSRSKGTHEHTFVESTTAVGITRRVCLECGHVSIGVSD